MGENAIRRLAKKIQNAKTFQELHDIVMEYAKDELDFVEFPESIYDPTGGKQEHEYSYIHGLKEKFENEKFGKDASQIFDDLKKKMIKQKFDDLKRDDLKRELNQQKFDDLKRELNYYKNPREKWSHNPQAFFKDL